MKQESVSTLSLQVVHILLKNHFAPIKKTTIEDKHEYNGTVNYSTGPRDCMTLGAWVIQIIH